MNPISEACLGMFMGQSNMAGRGVAAQAPDVPFGSAYEYKAITEPDRLCPLQEPFGEMENDPAGVCEPGMKTGSMVSSFANAFVSVLPVPLVAVSCAKGGSAIGEWQPGMPYYEDAVRRYRKCEAFLASHDIPVRDRFMVWCQGCTDGDLRTDRKVYRRETKHLLHSFMQECGIETCFLIQIGNHRDDPELYVPYQEEQADIARFSDNIILVSQSLKTFAAQGLMKDEFHYKQEGYNRVGTEAGRNAALHLLREQRQTT
ncbi:MAG: hypothetical protein IJT77_04800 [Clostridia bacterium]|nr:hypothetical protein [Clostridia bacterium]